MAHLQPTEMRASTVLALSVLVSACAQQTVRPVDIAENQVLHVCIRHNSRVLVKDFLPVVQRQLEHNAITSEVVRGAMPTHCEYQLRYTAQQTWDFSMVMLDATLWLDRNGSEIGRADYHINRGSWSPDKWSGTESKIAPLIDQLFAGTTD